MRLPFTVIVLGLVSLLNDTASDMIAPLLPVFLAGTLGAGPAAVGLIEGVAETASSLLKLWAGRLGDRGVGHKKLALGGYTVSNVLRPLIGFAASWPMVLLLRFGDRIGKGLRTAPRDALLAAAVEPGLRGRAFGLHRAMDHTGAMVGPLLAAALLAAGFEMREVFLFSIIPGTLVVVLLALGVREQTMPVAPAGAPLRWSLLPPPLRGLILAAGGLALAAIPDAFLVLWLGAARVPVAWIPALWALAHGFRALVALRGGWISDRLGRLPVMVAGWLARAALLLVVPWVSDMTGVIALFFLYAAATAATEGAERALIGDIAAPEHRGTAFGVYHMTVGALALPGALWFGAVWQFANMRTAFIASSLLTLFAALWFAHRVR
jgi:MFS family permease